MALSRLGNRTRAGDFTWPGFVDALASLLMVFVFVLMVFVLIQANLAYRLSGQDESLIILREELAMLGDLLSLERAYSHCNQYKAFGEDRILKKKSSRGLWQRCFIRFS